MDILNQYKMLLRKSGNDPEIMAFLQLEDVLNARFSEGRTPLLLACFENETAVELIAAGANVKLFDCNKLTPLHYAAVLGTPTLVRLIVEKGGDVNAKDFYGKTPLHIATCVLRDDVARILVEAGSDVNALTCWFDTPLDDATRQEYLELVQLLNPSSRTTVGPEDTVGQASAYRNEQKNTGSEEFMGPGEIVIDIEENSTALVKNTALEKDTALEQKNTDLGQKDTALEQKDTALEQKDTSLEPGEIVIDSEENGTALKGKDTALKKDTAVEQKRTESASDMEELASDREELASDREELAPDREQSASDVGESASDVEESASDVEESASDVEESASDVEESASDVEESASDEEEFASDEEESASGKSLPFNISRPMRMTELIYRSKVRRIEPHRRGYSPFNFLIAAMQNKIELVKLFIKYGAYISPVDYYEMLDVSELKEAVLQDKEMCSQALLNKYNNEYLAKIYTKDFVRHTLPTFKEMKIVSKSKVGQDIVQIVDDEIQRNGHCNVLEVRIISLRILSLKALFKIISTE